MMLGGRPKRFLKRGGVKLARRGKKVKTEKITD